MYKFFVVAFITASMGAPVIAQNANQVKSETIKASYLIALGKKATDGEVNYWMGQNLPGNDMLKTLVENHRQYMQGNPEVEKDMIRRSFKNAYGRDPNNNEVLQNMRENKTYSEWINNHVAWLRKTPSDYEHAIRNAYQIVLGRQPQSGELNYWKSKTANAFYIVASCVENCKRSGGAGYCASNVMATNSSYASTLAVLPQVAAQGNSLLGTAAGNVIAPGGGNVVAAGGGNVVAAGGLN
ncbi:MAG: hypothetical protein JWQ96_2704 [Segetibacter sp.]|nr:hypothetical protein [Segetibacter sp.]